MISDSYDIQPKMAKWAATSQLLQPAFKVRQLRRRSCAVEDPRGLIAERFSA